MKNTPIYLDYSSTTPIDKRVLKALTICLKEDFGNPASRSHSFGWKAKKSVEHARKQVSELINSDPREIIWTSGATESNNLAIKGAANFYSEIGNHVITIKTEHKSVLDTCRQLETQGFELTYLSVKKSGLIDLNKFKSSLKSNTILVSTMLVNNEIGIIQDIEIIGKICKDKNILFHVDAAQSTGKIKIDVNKLCVDLMSFSAHKTYGPKGIGALYIRRKPRIRIKSQIHGGGHERGFRSGTLPTHQIIGMGEAFYISNKEMNIENEYIYKLRNKLWYGLSKIEEIYLNGDSIQRVPHNLNISFNYIEGESLIMSIKELAVSSGSACTSSSLEPSYVLKSLGVNDELAHSSIRFTIGRFTSESEIDKSIELINNNINKLREMSPLWELAKDGVNLNKFKWNKH